MFKKIIFSFLLSFLFCFSASAQPEHKAPTQKIQKLSKLLIERGSISKIPVRDNAFFGKPVGYFQCWKYTVYEEDNLTHFSATFCPQQKVAGKVEPAEIEVDAILYKKLVHIRDLGADGMYPNENRRVYFDSSKDWSSISGMHHQEGEVITEKQLNEIRESYVEALDYIIEQMGG